MPSLIFFLSFLSTVILIVILTPWAQKIGLMDRPNQRKRHQKPVPLIGGVAIFVGLTLSLLLSGIQPFHEGAFILAATILVVVGLIDDYKEMSVKYRLIAQVVAVLIMTEIADVRITNLGNIFGIGESI